MSNVFETLMERGFIKQLSHEQEIKDALNNQRVTFYVGFDPTADSLHVGHYLVLMAMAHMQRAGHRPIALVGAGTTMVGDPSGRTDMRQMLTLEQIDANARHFGAQIAKLIDFSQGKALMLNNAEWLRNLNYLDFLRDIGVHFSVNRMLTAECFKNRLERGLSFLEFNYMLMQAYDFLVLNQRYDCCLQLGGDDQWSNILAGARLIRSKEQKPAYALTLALLTTSEGVKMGKTAKGALWLDPEKTSPYEFYQYWRNVADADVEKCLKLLTFLPLEEIAGLVAEGQNINDAKKRLAFEVTAQIHGVEEAQKAQAAAQALFGGGGEDAQVPTVEIDAATLEANPQVADLMVLAKLAKSKSDARRLIQGGGVSVNGEKVADPYAPADAGALAQGALLKKGKKGFCKVLLK